MIRLPGIELGMQRTLIIEIAVAPIDRQERRRDRHQHCARPAADRLVAFARSDHHDLVPEAARRPQLGVHVRADTAAARCVESANIDDPHGPKQPTTGMKLK